MSTKRQQQVNSLLQREISGYIIREGLEGLRGVLTVTGADVTPDLRHAKIFFSVIGQDEQEVSEILRKHVYEIQGFLGRKLEMKIIPRISFVPDRSGEYAQHISQLIKDMKKEDGDKPGTKGAV